VTFAVSVLALVLATNVVAPTAAYPLASLELAPGADACGAGPVGLRCELCVLLPEVLANASLTSVHGNPLMYGDGRAPQYHCGAA